MFYYNFIYSQIYRVFEWKNNVLYMGTKSLIQYVAYVK